MNRYIAAFVCSLLFSLAGGTAAKACTTQDVVESTYLTSGAMLTEKYVLTGEEADLFIASESAPVPPGDRKVVVYVAVSNNQIVPIYLIEFFVDGCAMIEGTALSGYVDDVMATLFPPPPNA